MASESIALSGTGAKKHLFLSTIYAWLSTVDHKRLGILYILFALIFLGLGGIEATIMRFHLVRPLNDFVSPELFNRMFTMHGTTMIFFVAMPLVFGFANYMVPLMIGARDMAFPRLNAFSFWMTAFGALILYSSFLGGNGFIDGGRRRMVRLRALDVADVLAGPQLRFLDAGTVAFRGWQRGYGH
jgi:cytochrome c oxidase subunit 1